VNLDNRIPICAAHWIQDVLIWAKFQAIRPPATEETACTESDYGAYTAAPPLPQVHLASVEEERDNPDPPLLFDAGSQEPITVRDEIESRARIPIISLEIRGRSGEGSRIWQENGSGSDTLLKDREKRFFSPML
jgi:hypothetical protein